MRNAKCRKRDWILSRVVFPISKSFAHGNFEHFRISNFEFLFLMDDALLTADGISKRFGNIWALQGVGFSLRRGEVLGLIGRKWRDEAFHATIFESL